MTTSSSSSSNGIQKRENLKSVSKSNRCPVCNGDHKCALGDEGLIICGRMDKDVHGFWRFGPSPKDPQFHLYRRDDVPFTRSRFSDTKNDSRDQFQTIAETSSADVSEGARLALCQQLQLPIEAFGMIPMIGINGKNLEGWTYTFPEVDANGKVVGIVKRLPDGSKKAVQRSKRGLSIPTKWDELAGHIMVVEGPTDVMALALCGIPALGRPSNRGGVEYLIELLKPVSPDRQIWVIGENDERPSKKHPEGMEWPGKEGAEFTAHKLAEGLERPVLCAMVPDGYKDPRAWVVEQISGAGESVDGLAIGQNFLRQLQPIELRIENVKAPLPPGSGRRTSTLSKPTIQIGTDEHRVNDEAVSALSADPELYQRGGKLVQVTCDLPSVSPYLRRPSSPRINLLDAAVLRERMTRFADWGKMVGEDENAEFKPSHPPTWSINAVHARGMWPGVRSLEAVIEYPLFLGSGEILTTPGFHRSTGILHLPPNELEIKLLDRPTRVDAISAACRLLEVVKDFPFVADAHKAAWLAALLTPISRFAFSGPTPLFLADANCPGTGKGLLLDVISHIVTGHPFAVSQYTNDREELRKLITSIAVEGDRLVLFDNLEGAFGNSILDMLLTATTWKGRILGTNTTATVPLFTVWYATGNNVSVHADSIRRICPIRLETPLENPENRHDFQKPDLIAWVSSNRNALLADVLTILSAWHGAGRPDYNLIPLGSYGGWSSVIRNAVKFCDLPDPAEARAELKSRSNVVADMLSAVLIGLEELDPERHGLTASQIIERVFTNPPPSPSSIFCNLRTALEEFLTKKDSNALGYKLRHHQRRIFAGRYLDTRGDARGSKLWVVYRQDQFNATGQCKREDLEVL